MKRTSRFLPLAALLAATANAQSSSTVVNDPSDSSVLTVFYSTCPTAVTTTTTLSSTITFCPGPGCNGGSPTITPPATTHSGGLVGPIATGPVVDWTTVGPDGKTTVLRTQTTVYDALGADGSLKPVTYTITETCPCLPGHEAEPTIPAGFTKTVVECKKCGADGRAATVTLTTPCETGPYAVATSPVSGDHRYDNGTLSVGPGAGAGAGASAAASAYASAYAAGSGANAAAGAAANAAASAGAGSQGSDAVAAAGAEAAAAASAGYGAGSSISPPASKFTGSADRTAIALSSVFAVMVGCMAWML